eukprot:12389191-Alexandrium_andersonii.AAC.1
MSASLVGSEMCIRDSPSGGALPAAAAAPAAAPPATCVASAAALAGLCRGCLLYTSDAADDM